MGLKRKSKSEKMIERNRLYSVYPNRDYPARWGEEVTESLDPEKVMFPFLKKGVPENYASWLIGSLRKGKNANDFNEGKIGSIYIAQDGATILPLCGASTKGIDNIIVPEDVDIKYVSNTDNIAQGFWAHLHLYFMKNFEQPPNCGVIPLYSNILPLLKGNIFDEHYKDLSEKMRE